MIENVIAKTNEEEIQAQDNVFYIIPKPFKNGRTRLEHLRFEVENEKLNICYVGRNVPVGYCERITKKAKKNSHAEKEVYRVTHYIFTYKKGARTTVNEVHATKHMQLAKEFKALCNMLLETPNIVVDYYCEGLTYRSTLFAVEYIDETLKFSISYRDYETNAVITENFATVTENQWIEEGSYDLRVIAFLLGHDLLDTKAIAKTKEHFMQLVKLLNRIHASKATPNWFEPLKTWYDEQTLTIKYLPTYQERYLERVFTLVKDGLSNVQNIIETDCYSKLNNISAVRARGYSGRYRYATSELEFDVALRSISTVYHEYGHLIYYSLQTPQIVGEEQAVKNAQILEEFLVQFRDCQYIQYLKEDDAITSNGMTYYRSSTELFARFFESYMMFETGEYDDKEEQDIIENTNNTKVETSLFIEFMDKNKFWTRKAN